jgi:HlyD family secretion protein
VKKLRIIFLTVIITIVVFSIVKVVIQRKFGNKQKNTIVRIEEAKLGQLTEIVTAPGEIEPKTKVDISAKVSGRVVELPYKEGERVTGGNPDADPTVPPSVLIRLDSKNAESQLRSAQASHAAQAAQIEVEKSRISSQKSNLQGLAATLKQSKKDFERQKQLLESRDISQSVFDQALSRLDELKNQYEGAQHSLNAAELNLQVLEHNLEAADARIAQAQDQLEYTTITSPIDGIVTRINAEVGEVVMTGTMNNPGTVIMQVADLSQMLLVTQVDETDVAKLKVGQKAAIRVQAFWDREFEGVVDTIALTHDLSRTGAKYFKTEILLKDDEQLLNSGLTANADIQTKVNENIISLPNQAILGRKVDGLPLEIRENNPLIDMDKTYSTVVYRYIDEKAVVTPVKIGASDLTHTIILEGVSVGDKIIVGPYKELDKLAHDQQVKDEKQAAAEEKTDKDSKKSLFQKMKKKSANK